MIFFKKSMITVTLQNNIITQREMYGKDRIAGNIH